MGRPVSFLLEASPQPVPLDFEIATHLPVVPEAVRGAEGMGHPERSTGQCLVVVPGPDVAGKPLFHFNHHLRLTCSRRQASSPTRSSIAPVRPCC